MLTPTNSDRPRCRHRQLCAIAKALLEKDPALDTVEWKERIKDRAIALGFGSPWTEEAYRAMSAIEHAHPTLRQAPALTALERRPAEIPAEDDPRYWTRKPSRLRAPASPEAFTRIDQAMSPELRAILGRMRDSM